MESEISALKLAFSTNNEWFEYSTIVVLAGLVFELVTLLAFHKTASWREKGILIAGTLVIAIGVAGEWHFGSKASAAALRLQAISDEKVAALARDTEAAKKDIAEANERAAKLEKQAAEARAGIANANARTAEASQKAAEAELALIRAKKPRTLDAARQQFVANAVWAYTGQRYRVAISQAADDGPEFWESLYAALTKAGWIYLAPPPNSITMASPPAGIPIAAIPGVEILFDPAKRSEMLPIGLALGNALHADEGMVVAVHSERQSNPDENERSVLVIRIGTRVPPP